MYPLQKPTDRSLTARCACPSLRHPQVSAFSNSLLFTFLVAFSHVTSHYRAPYTDLPALTFPSSRFHIFEETARLLAHYAMCSFSFGSSLILFDLPD